jgi:hypothetical protein
MPRRQLQSEGVQAGRAAWNEIQSAPRLARRAARFGASAARRDYPLRQEFVTPIRLSKMVSSNASFAVSKRNEPAV